MNVGPAHEQVGGLRTMHTLAGHTLLESLEPGDLGTRFLALVPDSEERVIVECLDPDWAADPVRVETLMVEIASASRAVTEGLEAPLAAGRAQGEVWVRRALPPPGWSLRTLLDYGERISEPLLVQVSVWIAGQVARALAHAHRRGCLHGAVAPEAVQVHPDGRVTLRDLGLGCVLGATELRMAYRAPELVASDLLTPRADVYGVGCLLLGCLLGDSPFRRWDPVATRRAIIEHRLPRVRTSRPSVSPRLDAIIEHLCALDPESRPRGAEEAARILADALGPSEDLVPSVLARQLERVPAERALDPGLLERARKRRPSPPPRAPSRTVGGSSRLSGPAPSLPELGRVDGFILEAHLGQDGPIHFYRGVDAEFGRPVRLHLLLPEGGTADELPEDEWASLFAREAEVGSAVAGHPNILRLERARFETRPPILAYAPAPEATLEGKLNRGEPLDPSAILLDLARALAHMHGAGALACGLTSRAVRVSGRGLAILCDLSKATFVGAPLHPLLDRDPFCLSPEFAASRRHDARSDLFALGVVAYELTTGTRPFRGLDTWSVLEALRTRTPRSPAEIADAPAILSELTMQLLARDPSRRPADAGEVVERLESWIAKAAR